MFFEKAFGIRVRRAPLRRGGDPGIPPLPVDAAADVRPLPRALGGPGNGRIPGRDAKEIGDEAFPLARGGKGSRVRIVALMAGKGLERRLSDMGLPVGAEIEILHREGWGRMVVARDHARVALGAGMTHKILVVPAAGPER